MKPFINEDFLLQNEPARSLYHDYAEGLPIIDYHCHLNPAYVASDYRFDNLGQIWLEGDHYKWRAMRANGIQERYITGKNTTDRDKYDRWAATVPYTMGNPLYHWTHLELKTAFGIDELLSPATADGIYDRCSAMLQQPGFSARGLMQHYNVEVACTTDDPVDTLEHHIAIAADKDFKIKVLPTWRPDKVMAIESVESFRDYLIRLGETADMDIRSYDDLLIALKRRHDFFHNVGCRLSDHGLPTFYASDYTEEQVRSIFANAISGKEITVEDADRYRTAILVELGIMDHDAGWVQQFHYGPIRNTNSHMFSQLGPDAGFDSIGDGAVASKMARFLDMLCRRGKLAKTILYNINPCDNELVATMAGNFQDGSYGAGKIQFGSGWWFLDQKNGIERQLGALSSLGLLSRFVGMLTDSRSFLSYPRHEYFRRILCNFVGKQMEQGLLPASEIDFIGREIIAAVSYTNAKSYFKFE